MVVGVAEEENYRTSPAVVLNRVQEGAATLEVSVAGSERVFRDLNPDLRSPCAELLGDLPFLARAEKRPVEVGVVVVLLDILGRLARQRWDAGLLDEY